MLNTGRRRDKLRTLTCVDSNSLTGVCYAKALGKSMHGKFRRRIVRRGGVSVHPGPGSKIDNRALSLLATHRFVLQHKLDFVTTEESDAPKVNVHDLWATYTSVNLREQRSNVDVPSQNPPASRLGDHLEFVR